MILAYSRKQTKNLGESENISVEITLEDEVDFTVENKEECLNRLRSFVNKQLDDELCTFKGGSK